MPISNLPLVMTDRERIDRLESRMEAAYEVMARICAEMDIRTEDALEMLDVLADTEPKPLVGINEFGNMEMVA